MINEQILLPYFRQLYNDIQNKNFVIDKTGSKVVEIIGCKIEGLNPVQSILNFNEIKKTSIQYVEKELNWYLSESLSIINYVDDIKIWNDVCTKDEKKEINSNYGYLIFSAENYNQYENCKKELIDNQESRRAVMLYNRPSIWNEYDRDGMSDWICTYANQFFIRNNKLQSVYIMRSNDAVYGWINDFFWACYVYNKLYIELKEKYIDLQIGTIDWFSGSWHIYDRHFDLLQKIVESYNE